MGSFVADSSRRRSRRGRLRNAACLALTFASQLPGVQAAFGSRHTGCIRSADHVKLNKLLSDGGPGTHISLCQGQTYPITGPIFFTAKDQEISTEGYPEDDAQKARIVLADNAGADLSTAIQGDCRRCARVAIKNVIIDGNRRKLGRIVETEGTALVLLGNNEGHSIRNCRVVDPRGWTAIQIREGDALSCTGAAVEDNVIGPAGEEWVEALDGDDPENSPLGRPLADGLTLACRDSVVKRNTFVDTTDAAIVIYGAPGSLVESNHIRSERVSQMAGILMIDFAPFEGDYSRTVVHNNTLEAEETALMRIGIALGPPVWSDDTETWLHGGTVTSNKLRGLGMGYGIGASNLKDFTVTDNESTARHGGYRGSRCLVPADPDEPGFEKLSAEERENGVVKNPLPMAFVRNAKLLKGGDYQEDFVSEDFSYLVCLDPDPSVERSHSSDDQAIFVPPARKAAPDDQQPEKVAPKPSVGPKTGLNVVDEILSHSQHRMLEAMEALGKRVDDFLEKAALERKLAGGDVKGKLTMEEDGVQILASLSHLSNRVASLETERKNMRQMMDDFRLELEAFGQNMRDTETREDADMRELHRLLSVAVPQSPEPDIPQRSVPRPAKSSAWGSTFAWVFSIQILVASAGLAWQRWRRNIKHDKVI